MHKYAYSRGSDFTSAKKNLHVVTRTIGVKLLLLDLYIPKNYDFISPKNRVDLSSYQSQSCETFIKRSTTIGGELDYFRFSQHNSVTEIFPRDQRRLERKIAIFYFESPTI
jgi:hypothetical protein